MCDPTGIPYVLFHGLLLNKPVSFPLGEPTSRQVGVTPVLPYVVQPYRASPYVLHHITPHNTSEFIHFFNYNVYKNRIAKYNSEDEKISISLFYQCCDNYFLVR